MHLRDESVGRSRKAVDQFGPIVAGARAGSTMSRSLHNTGSPAPNQADLFSISGNTAVQRIAAATCEKPQSAPSRLVPKRRLEAGGDGGSPAPGLAAQSPLTRHLPLKPHLLDVRAAAAWLGLSKSTLDKMRCTGQGPRFIRATGRAVRYDPQDIEAFAKDRRQRSTSETIPSIRLIPGVRHSTRDDR